MQDAFDGLFANMKVPGLTWLFRTVIGPWSRFNAIGQPPSDKLGHEIARAIQEKEGARTWLTDGIYVPESADEALGKLEHAFRLSRDAYHVGQTIKDAIRDGRLPKRRPHQVLDEALEQGVITQDEYDLVYEADAARERYIQVDEFALDEYRTNRMLPGSPAGRGALASDITTDVPTRKEADIDPDVDVAVEDTGDGAAGTPSTPEKA
jgi:acyl-CoA dehydrogenase